MLLKRNNIYISEIDLFLQRFDNKNPKSAAQLAEIKKYQRIYDLRDKPQPPTEGKELWEGF